MKLIVNQQGGDIVFYTKSTTGEMIEVLRIPEGGASFNEDALNFEPLEPWAYLPNLLIPLQLLNPHKPQKKLEIVEFLLDFLQFFQPIF